MFCCLLPQSKFYCCERHHYHRNSYKGNLKWGFLTVSEVMSIICMVAYRQTCCWRRSWGFYIQICRHQEEWELLGQAFKTKVYIQWYTSLQKCTPMPTKPHLLIFLKQCYSLMTKHSNIFKSPQLYLRSLFFHCCYLIILIIIAVCWVILIFFSLLKISLMLIFFSFLLILISFLY